MKRKYTAFDTHKPLTIDGRLLREDPDGYDIVSDDEMRDIMWAVYVDLVHVDDDNDSETVEVRDLL